MAGDVWPILMPGGVVLGLMAMLFITMAYRKITKRLER
jgi:ABC-2 type transport system permease protein